MGLTFKNTDILLEYIAETTRNSPVSAGTLQRPSDGIINVTLTGKNSGEVIYSINDYDGQDTVYGTNEYTLSFDYYLQRTHNTTHTLANSIEYNALTRASGQVTPLTFYLHTESDVTYQCAGSVLNSYNLTPEETRIKVSVEYAVTSVDVAAGSDYAGLTSSSACGTTFEQFQGATCTRSGSFGAGVSGFSFTINNNVQPLKLIGASSASHYESLENLSGSVNILLNDGGEDDWLEVTDNTEASIVFASGTSTSATDCSLEWTFANAHFSEIPINISVDAPYVESGINWKAETVTLASVT